MAKLTKTRMRAPLAEGELRIGWTGGGGGAQYDIGIDAERTPNGDFRLFRLILSPEEARRFVVHVAENETKIYDYHYSASTPRYLRAADALRELANQIEREAAEKAESAKRS